MWSLKNLESLGKKHTQKLRYLYPVLETNFQDLEIGHHSFSKLSQFKEKKEENGIFGRDLGKFTCSLIVQQLVLWPVDEKEIVTCSLIVQQLVLWPVDQNDDDDELMLNVLRCHLTY